MSKQIYVPSDYGILDEPTEAKWYIRSPIAPGWGSLYESGVILVPSLTGRGVAFAGRSMQFCSYSSASHKTSVTVGTGYPSQGYGSEYPQGIEQFPIHSVIKCEYSKHIQAHQFCQIVQKGTTEVWDDITFRGFLLFNLDDSMGGSAAMLREAINSEEVMSINLQNIGISYSGNMNATYDSVAITSPSVEFKDFTPITPGEAPIPTDLNGINVTSSRVMAAKNKQTYANRLHIHCVTTYLGASPRPESYYNCGNALLIETDALGQKPADVFAVADWMTPNHTNPVLPYVCVLDMIRLSMGHRATGTCYAYLGKLMEEAPDGPEYLVIDLETTFKVDFNCQYTGYDVGYMDCPKV